MDAVLEVCRRFEKIAMQVPQPMDVEDFRHAREGGGIDALKVIRKKARKT